MIQRVPTGVDGLDELLEGGFPAESLILIAGCPGAGKTTLASQFLYGGASKYGDKCLYVCFSETKETFNRNALRFGWDFERLEMEGRVGVLDLSTTKEVGIQSNLNLILEKIKTMRVKRLVIDSFTAMSMAITETSDVRFLTHLIYKFLQRIGCTTIMITDTPWGTNRIGSGVEEFIADGIILMDTFFDEDGNLNRRLRIIKMRATNHTKRTHQYFIDDKGLHIQRKTI